MVLESRNEIVLVVTTTTDPLRAINVVKTDATVAKDKKIAQVKIIPSHPLQRIPTTPVEKIAVSVIFMETVR